MSTPRIRALVAVALASLLVFASAATALGYISQREARVVVSGRTTFKCNDVAFLTARVTTKKGNKPVNQQIVKWQLVKKQSSRDQVTKSSRTNRNGNATGRVKFGPKPGLRIVKASIRGASDSHSFRCIGGLPKTSTVPPAGFVEQASNALLTPPEVTATTGDEVLPATAIRMERLGIDLPLVEGDGYSVTEGAASHFPGTAWPGEGSNTYIYAHAREKHFLELWRVRTGDRVEVDMADGSVAAYEVSEIHPVVPWDALEYLEPSDSDVLTLQTCLTYEDTAPRFVVVAERLGGT
jgi:LPXTG-site transpeptidase (sortase) family protein